MNETSFQTDLPFPTNYTKLKGFDSILNGTRKTVIEVDFNDLDEAITLFLKSKNFSDKNFDKYGYECIAENEWCNYQEHSFTVEPEFDNTEELEDLSTSELLNYMCYEKIIEPGEYLINVSW